MIVEQIRYFFQDDQLDAILSARREVSRVRREAGVPSGQILLADLETEDVPALVWQCGYTDETELGTADAALIGNAQYEAARQRLSELVVRVELELYTIDEENDV